MRTREQGDEIAVELRRLQGELRAQSQANEAEMSRCVGRNLVGAYSQLWMHL